MRAGKSQVSRQSARGPTSTQSAKESGAVLPAHGQERLV